MQQQLLEPLDQYQMCLYRRQRPPKPAMKVNSYNDNAFPNKYHYCIDIPAEKGTERRAGRRALSGQSLTTF